MMRCVLSTGGLISVKWCRGNMLQLKSSLLNSFACYSHVSVKTRASSSFIIPREIGSRLTHQVIGEIDNANQITLRYWFSEFESIEESILNPPCISTAQKRAALQNALFNHVPLLKRRVDAL